jgi:ABC-type Fe3+/spermidine/putrescine transport system ATPase subunit
MSASSGGDRSVTLRGVGKHFGGSRAVDHVDLEILGGEFFSLLGPSGCGKTTLLRMIGGFEAPSAGRIEIGGLDVSRLPPEQRPTNMVFQSYALFPHLDVAGNVGFGLRKERLGRDERSRRVQEALALVRMEGMEARKVTELSGGQRQRVALARALIKRPKVLLLDEPLAALDRRLREAMQRELRELQQRLTITFVFVTHDQDEAFAMSDRIAIMEGGRVLQVAKPLDLYRRPNCARVASFVGTINLLPGRIEQAPDGAWSFIAGSLGVIPLPAAPPGLAPGAPALLAVRPEQVRLADAPDAALPSAVPGRVESVVYLGDRTYVSVLPQGGSEPILACLTGLADTDRYRKGAEVQLNFSRDLAVMAE